MALHPNESPAESLAGALDEFEKQRRIQETRNELIIALFRLVTITVAAAAIATVEALRTHRVVLPYHIVLHELPRSVAILFGCCIPLNIALILYLHAQPSYSRERKYLITIADVLVFFLSFVFNRGVQFDLDTQLPFAYIGVGAFLITLSGLRYSTRAVLIAGILQLLCSLLFLFGFSRGLSEAQRLDCIFLTGIILPVVTFISAYAGASHVSIHRRAVERERLARFLPPELVEQVARNPGLLEGKTERITATVFFADIRGFTSISEHVSPEQVVRWLNRFLEEMTAGIMEHGGMVDKYIGDAVMGVFGFPLANKDDPDRALRAALEMHPRLVRLNEEMKAEGLPALSIGIGLHTGILVAGAIGSSRRLDYTVIGDTVNVASRLEGMTRNYPVEILLSEATREALTLPIDLQEIATVQVKGRAEPIRLWSPAPKTLTTQYTKAQ